MENDFLEIINKGIPISTPVNILLNDLLEMTNNKEKLEKKVSDEFEHFIDYLKTFARSNDIEFFMTLCILSNPETLEKRLHFAPAGFVSSLLYNLNMNNICNQLNNASEYSTMTLDEFTGSYQEKLKQKIAVLRMTSTDSKLKKAFPMLYEKYQIYEKFYKQLRPIIKKLEDPKTSPIEILNIRSQMTKHYKENGIDINLDELIQDAKRFNVSVFCNRAADSLSDLLEHIDEVMDFLFEYSLNIQNLGIDPEYLELYVANQSMENCENGVIEDRQRFVYYVTSYFTSNKERKTDESIQITIGKVNNPNIRLSEEAKNGIVVTPKSLYLRYRKFLIENPDIKIIDLSKINFEGMNLEEVETFLLEYLRDLQANWDILPEEDLDKKAVKVITDSVSTLSEEEKERHKQRLMDLYVEKKELYGSTDPFFRIRGKDTFEGYVGFIYPNGKVILDKFFNRNGRLADGEAIYVMDIDDFYRLSQFSKSVLMKDSKVQRVIHQGAWQDKVRRVIEKNGDSTNTADTVRELIKNKKAEEVPRN